MDLGTANSIVIYNDQVVIDEPSIVAVDRNNNKVIAVGKRAQMMDGKTDNTNVETAVVSATGTKDDLYGELFAHKLQMVSPTNVERFMFDNWAIWDVKVV